MRNELTEHPLIEKRGSTENESYTQGYLDGRNQSVAGAEDAVNYWADRAYAAESRIARLLRMCDELDEWNANDWNDYWKNLTTDKVRAILNGER